MSVMVLSLEQVEETLGHLKAELGYRREVYAVTLTMLDITTRASNDPALSKDVRAYHAQQAARIRLQQRIDDDVLAQKEQIIVFLTRIVEAGPQSNEDMRELTSIFGRAKEAARV